MEKQSFVGQLSSKNDHQDLRSLRPSSIPGTRPDIKTLVPNASCGTRCFEVNKVVTSPRMLVGFQNRWRATQNKTTNSYVIEIAI